MIPISASKTRVGTIMLSAYLLVMGATAVRLRGEVSHNSFQERVSAMRRRGKMLVCITVTHTSMRVVDLLREKGNELLSVLA